MKATLKNFTRVYSGGYYFTKDNEKGKISILGVMSLLVIDILTAKNLSTNRLLEHWSYIGAADLRLSAPKIWKIHISRFLRDLC